MDIIEEKPKLTSERTILPQINLANKNQFTRQHTTVFASSYAEKQKQNQLNSNSTAVRNSGALNNGDSQQPQQQQQQSQQQQTNNKDLSASSNVHNISNGAGAKKVPGSNGAFVDSAGKEGPRPCNEVETFAHYLKNVPIPASGQLVQSCLALKKTVDFLF